MSRTYSALAAIALGVGVAVVASGAGSSSFVKAVGGSDCGRFQPPDVEVSGEPDPHYDPEQGETVETVDLVDTRTLENLTAEVVATREAQIRAADESLVNARQRVDGSENVVAMVSLDHQRSIDEAWALVTGAGLRPALVAHGYPGVTRIYAGEIPTVDAHGVVRTASDVAAEYVSTVQLLLDNASVYVSRDPSHAARAVLADAQRRAQDAVVEGIQVIGVAVTGTVDQVAALADDAEDLIVGVVPEGCDPQSAVVPESFIPLIAAHALDVPELDGGPLAQTSPVVEGR